MGISVIKITGGEILGEEKLHLKIRCRIMMGLPVMGEAVYPVLEEVYPSGYKIVEIEKEEQADFVQMVLYLGGPEFEQDWRDYWLPAIRLGYNTAVCWLTMPAFRELSIREQQLQLATFVDLHEVGNFTHYVTDNFKPNIKLRFEPEKTSGLSKFGGLPVAPEGFTYPLDQDGESGVFLCQFCLDELKNLTPVAGARMEGMLYVFAFFKEFFNHYTIKEVRVLYFATPQNLAPVALPADQEQFGTVPEKIFSYQEVAELPMEDKYRWIEQKLTEEEYEFESYLADLFYGSYDKEGFALLRPKTHLPPKFIRLATNSFLKAGYATSLNDEGQMVSRDGRMLGEYGVGFEASFHWRHLLDFEFSKYQFDLSNYPESYNDYNAKYTLLIPEEDLGRMDFSRVVVVNQRLDF